MVVPDPCYYTRSSIWMGSDSWVRAIIIQKERGEFINANGFTAWQGFDERGYEILFFDWEQLASDVVPVEPNTITVGSVLFVRRALRRLGVERPPLDYPP